MSKRRGANKENLEETRRIFLDIAREEFCESGYADASTSRIVEKSGMARGSLYYHFGDKHGLFAAVYQDMMDNAMDTLNTTMKNIDDPWQGLLTGTSTFIDLCMQNDFRKIMLIESQAALHYKDRFAIYQETMLPILYRVIQPLSKNGAFSAHTENTLAILIFGMLGEIGRSFDLSEDIKTDRIKFGQAFESTLSAMKNA